MRLLDLFCGAGGASMGYHRAGFTEIVGVDIKPQPRYPFTFVQGDAMTYPLDGFDAIHASPPCQAYSLARNNGSGKDAPDLVSDVRARLRSSGIPWVIENVIGAPLEFPVMLCGASFGLRTGKFDLARHRVFESYIFMIGPHCQHTRGSTVGVYGSGTNSYHRAKFGRCVTVREVREAMGIDWMSRNELSQAIPPAYTEWIGKRLIEAIQRNRR